MENGLQILLSGERIPAKRRDKEKDGQIGENLALMRMIKPKPLTDKHLKIVLIKRKNHLWPMKARDGRVVTNGAVLIIKLIQQRILLAYKHPKLTPKGV